VFAVWGVKLKPIIYSIGLVPALILVSGSVNHKILRAYKEYPIISLQMFDLAGIGISVHLHKNIIPGAWTQEQDQKLLSCYTNIWWDPYAVWAKDKCVFAWFNAGETAHSRKALKKHGYIA